MSVCLSVCLYVCLSPPSKIYFQASHCPTGHMTISQVSHWSPFPHSLRGSPPANSTPTLSRLRRVQRVHSQVYTLYFESINDFCTRLQAGVSGKFTQKWLMLILALVWVNSFDSGGQVTAGKQVAEVTRRQNIGKTIFFQTIFFS